MKRINPYKLFVGSFIPNWLLRRREISQGAKLCYARLAQYAGEDGVAYPSQPALAQEIGIGDRQVRIYLDELEATKLLESERLSDKRGRPQQYFFLWHPWMELDLLAEEYYRKDITGNRLPEIYVRGLRKNTSGETPSPSSSPPHPPNNNPTQARESGRESHTRRVSPSGFTEFWQAYPNKKNKGRAKKAWVALKPDAALQQKILASLVEARKSREWLKEGGEYIPHPASWLNAEGWEDEYAVAEEPSTIWSEDLDETE